MSLPPAFLDDLRSRTPLPQLIGRKTRLVRNGRQWKGCCPFHNEKTPSFYVYDDHFHCFGCGAHGDAISFLMRAEGASFREAVDRLAGEAGMDVPKPTPQAAAREARARDLYGVLAAAEAAYRRRLHSAEGRPALDYLRRRGLSDETIARFGLGWSGEGRGALAAELRAEGIETPQLIAAGLMKPRDGEGPPVDLFFNRVMFPIRDRRGRTISFGGRILGDGQPKYVNGPETELFHKRQSLYGLDLAREACFRGATLLVVEGYMDVIALHQAGFGGAVAPLGTALTSEQIEALWQVSPEPVLCFDGDGAGARAAARATETALPLLGPERSLKLMTLTGGEDPDTLVARGGAASFQALLDTARPLSVALYDLVAEGRPLATPEQRAALRQRLEAVARSIPDRTLSAEYRRALLDRYFEAQRSAPRGRGATPRARMAALPARPVIDAEEARVERARNLLALVLRHPGLIPNADEMLGLLDLPAGKAAQLGAAIMDWLAAGHVLDSAGMMDHLAEAGLTDLVRWALHPAGLCPAAQAAAQPKEVVDGWWHFCELLRGETNLNAELAEARRDFAATDDPAQQRLAGQRLIRLRETLAARFGAEADDGSATAPGGRHG